MTIATEHTEPITTTNDTFARTVADRRRHSIRNRHVPVCRVNGMGF